MKFTFIKNLLLYIVPLYFITLGLGIILFHIYLRFFVERSSYVLVEIKPFITEKHYLIFTAFIFMHVSLIIVSTVFLYKQKYPRTQRMIIIKIKELIVPIMNNFYWKPLTAIHDLIAPHIPGSGRVFLYLEKTWTKAKYGKKYFYSLIFILDIMPKLIVSLVFLVEVVIFGKIQYFFSVLSLVLIPVLFSIFLTLFESFAERGMPILKSQFLSIKGLGEPTSFDALGKPASYDAYEFVVKAEYSTTIDAEEEIRVIFQLEGIMRYASKLKEDVKKASPYVTLVTSTIFFIGGVLRIYLLLF